MQIDRETIIKLAHETLDRMAPDDYCREPYWTATDDELEHFFKLVAEHEREACAQVCEAQENRVVQRHPARIEFDPDSMMARKCAAAIRARGNNA